MVDEFRETHRRWGHPHDLYEREGAHACVRVRQAARDQRRAVQKHREASLARKGALSDRLHEWPRGLVGGLDCLEQVGQPLAQRRGR